jgi:MarR family transcriptional regulator for hemolysin
MNLNPLDQSIGHLWGQTYRKMNYYLLSAFKPYDITPEQWVVLCKLAVNDGITQKDLSIISEKDQPTLTRILDCLDKKHLMERRPNADDRRSFLVYITDEGRALFQELTLIEKKVQDKFLRGITEQQLQVFKAMCSQIQRNIENEKI